MKWSGADVVKNATTSPPSARQTRSLSDHNPNILIINSYKYETISNDPFTNGLKTLARLEEKDL
jgi:hypothetical protein